MLTINYDQLFLTPCLWYWYGRNRARLLVWILRLDPCTCFRFIRQGDKNGLFSYSSMCGTKIIFSSFLCHFLYLLLDIFVWCCYIYLLAWIYCKIYTYLGIVNVSNICNIANISLGVSSPIFVWLRPNHFH